MVDLAMSRHEALRWLWVALIGVGSWLDGRLSHESLGIGSMGQRALG